MSVPVTHSFSKRSRWDTVPNPLGAMQERLRERGESWLDLAESNPTRCRFRFHSMELLRPLSEAKNLHYEPNPQGLSAARQAICRYYAEKKATVSPEQVFLTASTSEAYGFLFRLLADAGETVLCAEPSYPLFDTLAQWHDVTLKKYPLVHDKGWRTEFSSLEALFSAETRALILVNPNNPTGHFVSSEERRRASALCAASDAALIADEVFLDFAWDENKTGESFASNTDCLTFTLGGISKMLGLPQMKLAWIVVSGPEQTRREAMARLEVIADAHLSVNTPSQTALTAWLSHREEARKEILSRIRVNRLYLERQLQKHSVGRMLEADGGWYAVIHFEGRANDEETAVRLLEEKKVLVHPGFLFDFKEEHFLVLSLIVDDPIFREGVDRLCAGLKDMYITK